MLSDDIKWNPQGSQHPSFASENKVSSGIKLVTLSKGQEVNMELHCVKGNGRDHAKWSPVSVAFYKLIKDLEFQCKFLFI